MKKWRMNKNDHRVCSCELHSHTEPLISRCACWHWIPLLARLVQMDKSRRCIPVLASPRLALWSVVVSLAHRAVAACQQEGISPAHTHTRHVSQLTHKATTSPGKQRIGVSTCKLNAAGAHPRYSDRTFGRCGALRVHCVGIAWALRGHCVGIAWAFAPLRWPWQGGESKTSTV